MEMRVEGWRTEGVHALWKYERGPEITCRKQRRQGLWTVGVGKARGLGVDRTSGFRFFPGRSQGGDSSMNTCQAKSQ